MLICVVSLNAQDTIKIHKTINYLNYKYNILAKKNRIDTVWKYKYDLSVDSKYIQAEYLNRAGRNFTDAGVLFLFSCLTGASIVFVPAGKTTSDINSDNTIRYCIAGVSGGFFISSLICFFVGAHDLNKAGFIIKTGNNKKYLITVEGNKVKFDF